jgi:hypothetical protein
MKSALYILLFVMAGVAVYIAIDGYWYVAPLVALVILAVGYTLIRRRK